MVVAGIELCGDQQFQIDDVLFHLRHGERQRGSAVHVLFVDLLDDVVATGGHHGRQAGGEDQHDQYDSRDPKLFD